MVLFDLYLEPNNGIMKSYTFIHDEELNYISSEKNDSDSNNR